MSAVPRSLGDALADRYRLDREIGAGGMATVYLAPFVPFDFINSNYDGAPDDRHFVMLRRNGDEMSRIVAAFNLATEFNSARTR